MPKATGMARRRPFSYFLCYFFGLCSTFALLNVVVDLKGYLPLDQFKIEAIVRSNAAPKYHSIVPNSSIREISSEEQLWKLFGYDKLTDSWNSSFTEDILATPSFCVPWQLDTDNWWIFHPTWEVFHEDDTHYCFHLIESLNKRAFFQELYHQQFEGDCSNVLTINTPNTGWGADMDWYGSGLMHGKETNRPFQLTKKPWHYAAPWDAGKRNEGSPKMEAVCEEKDMTCYFLPLSNCPKPTNFTLKPKEVGIKYHGIKSNAPERWFYDWIVRPRTWLRRRVYDFINKEQQIEIVKPCAAIHVRRGDVIMSGYRKYYAISEYLNVSSDLEKNVILLTDDANAIEEALHEFPILHWMFINRTRFRGKSGGFENHIASNDAATEVVAIMADFQLVQQCQSFVRGPGTFARVLQGYVLSRNSSARVWNIQKGRPKPEDPKSTINVSRSYADTPVSS